MKSNNLTKKELNESVYMTLGRLRIAIEYPSNTTQKRMIKLLEKVLEDIKNSDLKAF
jgi:hypothetical protein